jgi:hypothetical protein
MAEEPSTNEATFLPGDESPDRLFAAVGHAISCWEQMESQLAHLYTIFIGDPGRIDALADYGDENGIFKKRLAAVSRGGERFFAANPDQDNEGELRQVLDTALELSIERHRIAHGMIQPISTAGPPDEDGWIKLDRFVYYLGAPWYATKKLRMSWISKGSAAIDAHAVQFIALANRIAELNRKLHVEPLPLPFELQMKVADAPANEHPDRA